MSQPASASPEPAGPRRGAFAVLAGYALLVAAGLGLALLPEWWLVPRMTAFAAARSADGVVSQAGIDQMLMAVSLAKLAAFAAGFAGLAATGGLLAAARRTASGLAGEVAPSPADQPDSVSAVQAQPGWAWAAVLGMVGVFTAIWVRGLGKGLAYDEAYSALRFVEPGQPWEAFLRFETLNNHPLYSALASIAVGVFGGAEWGLRLPALFAAAACIPVAFLVARRFAGWPTGLLAAGLVCTSPILAEYAVQARGYSLLFLLSLASAWLFAEARGGAAGAGAGADARASRARIGWVIVSVLGLWTHLFMGVVILGQIGLTLIRDLTRGRVERAIEFWILGTVAVVIGGAGYLPVAHRLLFEIVAFTALAESVVGRSWADVFWLTGGSSGALWGGLGLLAVVGLGLLGVTGRTGWKTVPESAVVLGGPLAIGLLLVGATDQGIRFFVPVAALLSVAVALGTRRVGRAGGAVAAVLVLSALLRAPSISTAPIAGLRDFSAALVAEATPADCLVLEWSVGDVIDFYSDDLAFTYDRDFSGGCSTGRVLYGCHFCDRSWPGLEVASLADPRLSVADPTGRPYRLFVVADAG